MKRLLSFFLILIFLGMENIYSHVDCSTYEETGQWFSSPYALALSESIRLQSGW